MGKPTVGFIGLGLMGAAMANRLLDQGYALTITANSGLWGPRRQRRGATILTHPWAARPPMPRMAC